MELTRKLVTLLACLPRAKGERKTVHLGPTNLVCAVSILLACKWRFTSGATPNVGHNAGIVLRNALGSSKRLNRVFNSWHL